MSPKPSLAILTHEYYPVLCGGTVFTEKMAIELTALGYDVEVLTCGVGKGFEKTENAQGFRVTRFATGRKSEHDAKTLELLLYLVLGLPQMLWHCYRNKVDLLFPVFVIPSGFMAWVMACLLRIPTVVFVDAADTPGIQSSQATMMKLLTPLFKFVTRFSSGVVILQGLEDLASPLVHNAHTAIIPNGTIIPQAKAQPGTHGETVQFLSIGRLVMRKGFKEIIEALSIVKKSRQDFHLKIIGYGTREEEIRKALESHGLEKHISLIGRVEYEALKTHYLAADYYLFYGAREGSSLAMIEAVSYGLPVLASDDPGTRAYVHPGENGYLVDHLDPGQLAQAILDILAHKDRIADYGVRSREIALAFSWANIAKRYDVIFSEVMAGTSGRQEKHEPSRN